MSLSVTSLVKDTYVTAIKNIPSFLGASVLWLLTFWIPFVNVGTTIALFYALPIELSKGNVINPLSIFDGKYRKFMGEFFNIIGMMSVSILPAVLFAFVPAIIIGIGWCLAICLLIDRELNPAEALTESTRRTYGHKWAIFGANLLIIVVFVIAVYIFTAIAGAIGSDALKWLFILALIAVFVSLQVSFNGVLYCKLVREADETSTPVSPVSPYSSGFQPSHI